MFVTPPDSSLLLGPPFATGTIETTCNLWSVRMYEELGASGINVTDYMADKPVEWAARVADYRANKDNVTYIELGMNSWNHPGGSGMEAYMQLQQAFGWSFYETIFKQYRNISDPGSEGGEDDEDDEVISHQDDEDVPDENKLKNIAARVDEWVRRASHVADRNLGPFYQAWGFNVTQSVLDEIANLPAWAENPMM